MGIDMADPGGEATAADGFTGWAMDNRTIEGRAPTDWPIPTNGVAASSTLVPFTDGVNQALVHLEEVLRFARQASPSAGYEFWLRVVVAGLQDHQVVAIDGAH